MTPQEYLEFTRTTAARSTSGISDEDWATYVRLGLISEVGEVAGQVKRIIRDDGGVLTAERREKLLDELGDVLWYWAQRCDVSRFGLPATWSYGTYRQVSLEECAAAMALHAVSSWDLVHRAASAMAVLLGSTLEEVAARNVEKLSARVQAGTIHGEGDER